jgi:formylglycine-generating enzyme required for sulfatase activity
VGGKPANAWGLSDLHGNIAQWCRDAYLEHYETLPVKDPFHDQGDKRILRGGAWNYEPELCRLA